MVVYHMDMEPPNDLAVGTAAEHLVCFDLLMAGYRAFLADQNCPYDVAVEIAGRLVRVQVKATRKLGFVPQRAEPSSAYMWHVRRAGKAGRRMYQDGDFDALALVALDIKRVVYLPPEDQKQTVHIRPPGYVSKGHKPGKHFEDSPFERALQSIGVGHDDPLLPRRLGHSLSR